MAQSVECLTFIFGSGHELMVWGCEPQVGLPVWSLHGILSLSLSAPPPLSFSLSLSK